jgi:hypothetical protein
MISAMTTDVDGVSTSALVDTCEAGRDAARRRWPEALKRRMVGLSPRSAGSGRSLGLRLLGRPVPREQLVEPPGRVGGDAREQVAQVGLRIDAVELGGLDQCVDGGGALAAVIRAGEQVVLAAEGNLGVILPMSGRKLKFGTGGTRSMGDGFGAGMWSGALAGRSFTSKWCSARSRRKVFVS